MRWKEWGKHSRCGHHYGRLAPFVWAGFGYAGCERYTRHWTWMRGND